MRKIMEKPIIFDNFQGERLWGVLSVPEEEKSIPAVLMAHGFNATKSHRKFVLLSRALAQNGIAAFRFDFSGCGDSEGKFQKISITQQTEELIRAYETLIGQPEIDKGRIGIFGHSLGVLITCLFQRKFLAAKTLVLVAPALNQKDLIRDWHTPFELRRWRKQGFVDTDSFRIGIQYLREASEKDYSDSVSTIEIPTLIIHGSKDEVVLPRYSRELIKKFPGERELVLVQGADHDFEGYQPQQKMITLCLDWFQKHL